MYKQGNAAAMFTPSNIFRWTTGIPHVWGAAKGVFNAIRSPFMKQAPAIKGALNPTGLSHLAEAGKHSVGLMTGTLPGMLATWGFLLPAVTGETKRQKQMANDARAAKWGGVGAITGGMLSSVKPDINPFIGAGLGAGAGYLAAKMYPAE